MTKEELKQVLQDDIHDEGVATVEYTQLANEMQAWVNTLPPQPRAPGLTLRYYRAGAWQQVHCNAFPLRDQNLRQIYLLLDRLRIAEKNGVSYTGLTSTRALGA